MELEDSILDFSDEEESFEDDDVKMNDIEEGELVERISKTGLEESGDACASSTNPVSGNKNQRRKKNKRKNKRKRGSSGPKVTDINRFVLDVCKRLRERKSYLIWTAVGCLGVSALSDLVKERLAILDFIYPLISGEKELLSVAKRCLLLKPFSLLSVPWTSLPR
uniref:Phosphorylated adapter RNA export protein n=1 Tax=Nicotiana tabacum TaxID=4097 RepID=A0A1S3XC33_TOBAC|nr:PREDICTED: uncharacterized protein LOC107763488 isoform X1 [Nicotiana tabacum]